MNSSKVYVKFPNFGLGNRLLLWAKAYAFARENRFDLCVAKWWSVQPGAILRREKSKRLYWKYFVPEPFFKNANFYLCSLFQQSVYNESIEKQGLNGRKIFVFNRLTLGADYFEEPKPYRNEIRSSLYALLHPQIHHRVLSSPDPEIGVHIRRGDFLRGSVVTPLSFFTESIRAIRAECGMDLPVTVFSDAGETELKEILSLPKVQLSREKTDIEELLKLSRSKVLLLSIGSTFSYFAAFLSDGIVLKHPEDWQPAIRPKDINLKTFEGAIDPEQLPAESNLTQQIRKLSCR